MWTRRKRTTRRRPHPSQPLLRQLSTPARCTHRFARRGQAPARSAAWRSSRKCPRRPKTIPSWMRSNASSGSQPLSAFPWSRWRCCRTFSICIFPLARRRRCATLELLLTLPGGAVGRTRLLPPRLARGTEPLAEHVHADRAWGAGRLLLQPVCDFRAALLSAGNARRAWHASASISKWPRSSLPSCCSGEWLELAARGRTSQRDPAVARAGAKDRATHSRPTAPRKTFTSISW